MIFVAASANDRDEASWPRGSCSAWGRPRQLDARCDVQNWGQRDAVDVALTFPEHRFLGNAGERLCSSVEVPPLRTSRHGRLPLCPVWWLGHLLKNIHNPVWWSGCLLKKICILFGDHAGCLIKNIHNPVWWSECLLKTIHDPVWWGGDQCLLKNRCNPVWWSGHLLKNILNPVWWSGFLLKNIHNPIQVS